MLFKIPILTCLIFSALYPLSFWINWREPLKNNFHRFHLGVSCFVGGLAVILFWVSALPQNDKLSLIFWLTALLVVCGYYWKKPYPNSIVLTAVCALGILCFLKILSGWTALTLTGALMTVLGGMVLCAALFAMNLGHWYLNVHGLPIRHLRQAVYVFWTLVTVRALVDMYLFLMERVAHDGDVYRLWQFVGTLDGFLIILGVLFGTIFPLITLYFVKGTLDVKSTQSATGILYAVLCAVLIGDITAKFYLLKFGIAF